MKSIRIGVPLLFLAALTACISHDPLPKCHGPIFQMNTGHWQPTKADLSKPKERDH